MDLDLLLCVMAEIHEWEIEHHPALQTMVGRSLYFRIVHAHLNDHQFNKASLKQLIYPDVATERGIRLRIREFEKLGLIGIELNTSDKRTKKIMPTDKFLDLVSAHQRQVRLIFQKRFIVLDV